MQESSATIGRDLGRIFQAFSVMPLLSLPVALVWNELYAVPALLVSAVLPLGVGTALARRFAGAAEPGKLHGMMIAASGWFLVAVFGALPFLLVAWTQRFALFGAPLLSETTAAHLSALNAVFESLSGFTGTGLTMSVNESELPHTLQWWRSFIEWIGGVGVIVLTTAILARPGSGSLTLYESEARSEKIHPSIVSTVRTIWWIFLLFTVFAILVLWLAGMPMWDAVNHAMTGLATGGFSITDGSIATYDSPLIDFALLPIMVLGSIAFPVHYLVLRGDLSQLYEDLQTRWVFGFFGLLSAFLVAIIYSQGVYQSTETITFLGTTLTGNAAALFQSVRYGVFQFVSAASCTGFQTANSLGTEWSMAAQMTVSIGMVVGAAAGSTVGGIKLVRFATLTKGTAYRIRNVFLPQSAVTHFELGGRKLDDQEAAREFEEAAIITFLWVVFLAISAFVLMLTVDSSFTLPNVLFEVASAQGNVGLSAGITGPEMPTPAKVIFLFNMWIGRLEIIPVLVLLRGLLYREGVFQ
ncbi:potassium transporter Trk [Halarchaeum grantii]|uniref:Potassium transporter Trk n=1 Tax=Halarchaeum grantii TaxID=1193105 RepID=A0A830F3B8_9EURY|nr:TrkH family potassium uptake protein [Halarchaeum grantii]GGL36539.1 potassium transporter Trk [Halarchaeum grantii]